MAGFAFVMMLLITVIVEACTAGLPAIASGDFAVVGFSDICAPLPWLSFCRCRDAWQLLWTILGEVAVCRAALQHNVQIALG